MSLVPWIFQHEFRFRWCCRGCGCGFIFICFNLINFTWFQKTGKKLSRWDDCTRNKGHTCVSWRKVGWPNPHHWGAYWALSSQCSHPNPISLQNFHPSQHYSRNLRPSSLKFTDIYVWILLLLTLFARPPISKGAEPYPTRESSSTKAKAKVGRRGNRESWVGMLWA